MEHLSDTEVSSPLCPYSIEVLYSGRQATTYLVRENDTFGEFPNIYAKVYFTENNHTPIVVILSDTGTGLDVPAPAISNQKHNQPLHISHWNIASFLSFTINSGHVAPYIVLTTHCHYDHICGIQSLLDAKANVTVLASSHDKSYITPYANLQENSLCDALGLQAPKYDGKWIEDAQQISYLDNNQRMNSRILVIHTPGHTPDSLSWYDQDAHALCVGDMFYEQRQAPRDPVAPVIFTRDSSIIEWNASMHRLLDYVRYENRRMDAERSECSTKCDLGQDGKGNFIDHFEADSDQDEWSVISTRPVRQRVVLCASHVTIAADAETAILDMLAFMLRIQLDQVPRKKVCDIEGNDAWFWSDDIASSASSASTYYVECKMLNGRYSVRAPWSIIHKTTREPSRSG